MNEIEDKFGVNPLDIGLKAIDYDIITELDIEDKIAGAKLGDLCIITVDADEVDHEYDGKENYIGNIRDIDVPMYRYYYFGELNGSN